MAVTVFIPEKKKGSPYSAYVHGRVVGKYYEKDCGSLIRVEGTAAIFYAYSNYRRAVVFTETNPDGKSDGLPLLEGHIPLVKQGVRVLYTAESRRFDLLKHLLYRSEREFGKEMFGWETGFWLRVISLLDDYRPAKRRSAATSRNIRRLAARYKRYRRSKGINEDN